MQARAPAPDDDVAAVARRAIGGDAAAFRRLIELTHLRLFRVAAHIAGDRDEADDVVQETFIRAWQRLPELRDPGAAMGWLVRIVHNAAKDRLRARKRVEPAAPVGDAVAGASPDDDLAAAQSDAVVRRAVKALSEKHRVVLLLHEVDGMTAAEIAGLLDVPVGTVESRLSRARDGLAKRLRKEGSR